MKNCLIAQSGGPTSAINASLAGVLEENKNTGYFNKIYGGLYGIQGIISDQIIDLSDLTYEDITKLKYTPSSALGSCRYKLKGFLESSNEYDIIFQKFRDLDIDTFFYIGGNDSMDTVNKLSKYADYKNADIRIIGIPKTIDNDLAITDHTPGFGSAGRFIATTTLECSIDCSVYKDNGVLIIEAMGRDTGWLTACASAAELNKKQAADIICLPEVPFDINNFLEHINKVYKEQKRVIAVVSEGIKNKDGKLLSELYSINCKDTFGHTQLGGVSQYLKNMVLEKGITKKARNIELSIMQRCAMHIHSDIDIDESCKIGKDAVGYAKNGVTHKMIGIRRTCNNPYSSETFLVDTNEVANNIKYFPNDWIDAENYSIKTQGKEYILPLLGKLPEYIDLKNKGL
jgi:6-phosphofructokinase